MNLLQLLSTFTSINLGTPLFNQSCLTSTILMFLQEKKKTFTLTSPLLPYASNPYLHAGFTVSNLP